MARILSALGLLLFSFVAQAASYQTAVATGFSRVASGGWSFVGSGATAANQAFSVPATIRAAGKVVTMPAAARFAANAPNYVAGAVRSKNLWLAGGAIALWLGSEYLTNQAGQWMHAPNATLPLWGGCAVQGSQSCTIGGYTYSTAAAAESYVDSWASSLSWVDQGTTYHLTPVGAWPAVEPYTRVYSYNHNGVIYSAKVGSQCPSGLHFDSETNGHCVGDPVPATDSDWAKMDNHPVTEAAAVEAAANGVPVPVQAPTLATPVTEPISDPYVDPVTNTTKRDYVQATPSPTADDPFRVRLDTFTKPVDATTGQPTSTAPAEASKTDPPDLCEKNPNIAMCQELDKPDDVNLDTKTKTITITPDSGWGPDTASCPADVVLRNGAHYSYAESCDAASKLRPITLACAWIAAVMIALGLGSRSET